MGGIPFNKKKPHLLCSEKRLDASLPRHGLPQALLTLFLRERPPSPVTLYDLTQPF